MIWKQTFNVEGLNTLSQNTMVEHIGIEFTDFGDDYITAKMPVDKRTVQPMRLLHGGASAALAETLGSVAATLCVEDVTKQQIVGVELNANHLRSATSGYVYGTARPIKVGRKLQVWQIEIKNKEGKMICISRLTVMVIEN